MEGCWGGQWFRNWDSALDDLEDEASKELSLAPPSSTTEGGFERLRPESFLPLSLSFSFLPTLLLLSASQPSEDDVVVEEGMLNTVPTSSLRALESPVPLLLVTKDIEVELLFSDSFSGDDTFKDESGVKVFTGR
jgi:hypothetical protein